MSSNTTHSIIIERCPYDQSKVNQIPPYILTQDDIYILIQSNESHDINLNIDYNDTEIINDSKLHYFKITRNNFVLSLKIPIIFSSDKFIYEYIIKADLNCRIPNNRINLATFQSIWSTYLVQQIIFLNNYDISEIISNQLIKIQIQNYIPYYKENKKIYIRDINDDDIKKIKAELTILLKMKGIEFIDFNYRKSFDISFIAKLSKKQVQELTKSNSLLYQGKNELTQRTVLSTIDVKRQKHYHIIQFFINNNSAIIEIGGIRFPYNAGKNQYFCTTKTSLVYKIYCENMFSIIGTWSANRDRVLNILLIKKIKLVKFKKASYIRKLTTGKKNIIVNKYKLSKYLITNNEFLEFLKSKGKSHSYYYGDEIYKNENGEWVVKSGCENSPVFYVTWYQAEEYCNWLESILNCRISLPSEAHWEFAAYHRLNNDSFDRIIIRTGEREWCKDSFDQSFYKTCNRTEPVLITDNINKVVKGGFTKDKLNNKFAIFQRFEVNAQVSRPDIGFRIQLAY